MNLNDIVDLDVDSSDDKKCDSVHIPKMVRKKKIFIGVASLVLFFLFLAIYFYYIINSAK
jgi:hypothetical protein